MSKVDKITTSFKFICELTLSGNGKEQIDNTISREDRTIKKEIPGEHVLTTS